MSGETLIVVLPLVSLILASLSIAGLWYWWSGGKDANEEQRTQASATGSAATEGGSNEASPAPPSQTEDAVERLEGKSISEMVDGAMEFLDGQLSRLLSRRIESQVSAQTYDFAPPAPPPAVPTYTPPPPAPPPMYAPPAPSSTSTGGRTVEALRVLRDPADGSLIVEINGQQYRHPSEITDLEAYRRLTGNVQALMSFMMEQGVAQPPVHATPDQPAISTPPPPVAPPPPLVSRPSQPASQAGSKKGKDDAPPAPRTVAEQIEELLQYRLTLTPDLVTRSVHIRDAGTGGVAIEVDGRYYDSVADVPDTPVREFIQGVIREWEARQ